MISGGRHSKCSLYAACSVPCGRKSLTLNRLEHLEHLKAQLPQCTPSTTPIIRNYPSRTLNPSWDTSIPSLLYRRPRTPSHPPPDPKTSRSNSRRLHQALFPSRPHQRAQAPVHLAYNLINPTEAIFPSAFLKKLGCGLWDCSYRPTDSWVGLSSPMS